MMEGSSSIYAMKNISKKNTGDFNLESNVTEYYEHVPVSSQYEYYESNSRLRHFIDSFKPSLESKYKDDKLQEGGSKHRELKQVIKSRHVFMISLGTGIGTGLLVGSGKSLRFGGPGGLIIGYLLMGICVYCVTEAAGEMAVNYPALVGGFNNYPSFLVDPALGFATAWLYCIQWLCVFPLELVTATIIIEYWGNGVNPDIYVLFFYLLIIGINFFGALGYAEAEFFFNTCKVVMIVIFFIVGILINVGAVGNGSFIGAKYWRENGVFGGTTAIVHLKGIVATLVNAAFSFGFSEMIALTAAEQSNPRKSIPSATKKMFYKIFFLFLGSVTLISFLVPKTHPDLSGGDSKRQISPFVLAISSYGIKVIPHFINLVILLSLLSVGNSAFYSSSRSLMSLAEQKYAPKIFTYVDRKGRPLVAMIASIIFGCIGFVAVSDKKDEVFNWLLSISGLSQLFTWISICISHIRFRRAIKVQGRLLGELGYRSEMGTFGSWFASIVMTLALIGQFWTSLFPFPNNTLNIKEFFQGYMAMPIILAFYFGYRIFNNDWKLFIRSKDIDLVSHRRIFDSSLLEQEDLEYKEKLKSASIWYRLLDFWC